MNTECPYCGLEGAYHDGVQFVCPDCGATWDDDNVDDEDCGDVICVERDEDGDVYAELDDGTYVYIQKNKIRRYYNRSRITGELIDELDYDLRDCNISYYYDEDDDCCYLDGELGDYI